MPNKLKMNSNGNMYPNFRIFNDSKNYITYPATNLNSAPLYYVGNRTNTLSSSLNPRAYVVMNYGNLHNIYGNLGNSKNVIHANQYPTLSLNIDNNGNYKLYNNEGKSYKVYSNSNGNYVKIKNNKIYL
jgi:hypothetical protein